MIQTSSPSFKVTLQPDREYYRLCITHPYLKGRIRKRIGNRKFEDLEKIRSRLSYKLDEHFEYDDISREVVDQFIVNFIALTVNRTVSVFLYYNEFIESKRETTNRNTKKKLTKSTIAAYNNAKKCFEKFLIEKRHSSHPSMINKRILDDFYLYVKGEHNYKVKMHGKVKAFLKYVDSIQGVSIDPTYNNSVFTEYYNNLDPEDDDIALSAEQVHKLIELRNNFLNDKIEIKRPCFSGKIPAPLQEKQFNIKKENLIRCLDCFLFMIATGQYHSDIMKSKITIHPGDRKPYLEYTRAKNGSECKAIPIGNSDVFISMELIKQYRIRSGSNFPLGLSNTHFNLHLGRISELAGFNFKLNNKMARKTFASLLFFDKKHNMPIHILKYMLGHTSEKNTRHYLRIENAELAGMTTARMFPGE